MKFLGCILFLQTLVLSANADVLSVQSETKTYTLKTSLLSVDGEFFIENPDGTLVISKPKVVIHKKPYSILFSADSAEGFCQILGKRVLESQETQKIIGLDKSVILGPSGSFLGFKPNDRSIIALIICI